MHDVQCIGQIPRFSASNKLPPKEGMCNPMQGTLGHKTLEHPGNGIPLRFQFWMLAEIDKCTMLSNYHTTMNTERSKIEPGMNMDNVENQRPMHPTTHNKRRQYSNQLTQMTFTL